MTSAAQVEGDDPYCVCKLWNSPAALFRTPVVPNASNALWNHEQEVEYTPGEPLEFRVYDVDQAEEPGFVYKLLSCWKASRGSSCCAVHS